MSDWSHAHTAAVVTAICAGIGVIIDQARKYRRGSAADYLRRERHAADILRGVIDDFKEQVERLEEDIAEQQKTIARLRDEERKAMKANAVLQARNQILNSQIAELVKRTGRLEGRIIRLGGEISDVNKDKGKQP